MNVDGWIKNQSIGSQTTIGILMNSYQLPLRVCEGLKICRLNIAIVTCTKSI